MDNILETLTDIAIKIEKRIFKNYNDESSIEVFSICSELVKNEVLKNNSIKAIVSQDRKKLETINRNGKYILSYVSIDNINLLNLGFSVGSIFAVYEDEIDVKNLKYSCYFTYGPTFQLVFSSKDKGVEFFFFDGVGFVKQDSFKLENKGKINSTAGDVSSFTVEHKKLMDSFFQEGYRLRFSNSLSLDTHQIIFKRGGLYSCPVTKKDENAGLDLVFEAYPISFIIELCGGESIDGKGRILDIELDGNLSKKSPIYFGSTYEIKKVKSANG